MIEKERKSGLLAGISKEPPITPISSTGVSSEQDTSGSSVELAKEGASMMVRFYIQGVTEKGELLDWDKCVFVDAKLEI